MDATCTLATTENVTGRSYSLGVFYHGGGNIWDAGSGSSCHKHKFHLRGVVFFMESRVFHRAGNISLAKFLMGKKISDTLGGGHYVAATRQTQQKNCNIL